MKNFIKDDFLFTPYEYGGYQCKIDTKSGVLSIRFGGHGLFCDEGTYEVRYPNGEVKGDQTSDDIYKYIETMSTAI